MPGFQVSNRLARRAGAAAGLVAAFALVPQARAATNVFNMYVGAAYARSNLRARDSSPIPFIGSGPLNSFDRSDSGYQFSLGARGLELLGAEVDYFDLGSGIVSNAYGAPAVGTVSGASLSQKGEAAFGVLYLPVPIIDIYVKAGVDRISSDLGARFTPQGICTAVGTVGTCPSESLALHKTTSGLALGAGAQWQFGNWGLRAEYERFTAYGGHPDLVSLGVVWTFL